MKKKTKIVTLALAACMTASVAMVAAGCGGSSDPKGYTYRTGVTALATNWNPHAWETNADNGILSYVSSPLVDMTVKDSRTGSYQWVYEMATAVTDVTANRHEDLTKYGVTLQDGVSLEATNAGFVYEIKLRENAKWENGEDITADDYIYSMKQLINPDMKNYRANTYIADESELAGAYNYYYSKDASIFLDTARLVTVNPDGTIERHNFTSIAAAKSAGFTITLDMWNFYGMKGAKDAAGNECPQYVSIDDTTKYRDPNAESDDAPNAWVSAKDVFDMYESEFEVGGGYASYVGVFYEKNPYFNLDYDKAVGCYKVDDYTIRYVNQYYIDQNTFMTSLTSNWLVYEDTYEKGKSQTGALTTTTYNTKKDNTVSYGPYRFTSIDEGRQMKLEQNPNWYGWDKDESGNSKKNEDGYYTSHTANITASDPVTKESGAFLVDGKNVQQYQTTNVIIDVLSPETMETAFMKGELLDWAPTADKLDNYKDSDYLKQEDETYTMSFFFNTDESALTKLGESDQNKNCIVLINQDFRQAMSLSINRAQLADAAGGYKPAYSLLNNLYYYDIFKDPNSVYRNTTQAKQAIVELYGIEYGPDKTYKTLDEAYASINGLDMAKAKTLMKSAHDALVAAGKYKSGEPINIAIAWKAGAINSDDQAQLNLLNGWLNEAAEGSGFGKITLTQVGNMRDPNPYDAVPQGLYAIGMGAWGGAFLYPFRTFQVYMDPDKYNINEAGCWDPREDRLTINIPGKGEETYSYQYWCNSMSGSGMYATASNEVKLAIATSLEKAFLGKYYRIPLMGTVASYLLSPQVKYYIDEDAGMKYHVLYSFGGSRLMSYRCNNEEFAALVSREKMENLLNYSEEELNEKIDAIKKEFEK